MLSEISISISPEKISRSDALARFLWPKNSHADTLDTDSHATTNQSSQEESSQEESSQESSALQTHINYKLG